MLEWHVAGRFLGMWCGTPSLDSVQRNVQVLHVGCFLRACAALGIPAGEHSPFDSFLWKRPLFYRLMQRWNCLHVDFCAGGGRFRIRSGMLFIHCGTPPSCRYLHCHFAFVVRTFAGVPHQHWKNLDKKTALAVKQHASLHCCLCLGLLTIQCDEHHRIQTFMSC